MVRSRRFAQVSSSEEKEDFVPETMSQGQNSRRPEETTERKRRNRKKVRLYEDSDEEEKTERERKKDEKETTPEEVKPNDVKPVGEPVKVTGKGKKIRTHYGQFEYGGNRYGLEELVLLYREDKIQKPYIAIIKDITPTKDGSMMILVHWFYCQEEAKKKCGGNWELNDSRELFYSFHCDEVPEASVMHKCVVYFVPSHKQLPKRKDNTGFFVRKVYDIVDKKLWKLTDKVNDVAKQHQIDLLVEKSMSRLDDLPDLETNHEKAKR